MLSGHVPVSGWVLSGYDSVSDWVLLDKFLHLTAVLFGYGFASECVLSVDDSVFGWVMSGDGYISDWVLSGHCPVFG